MDNKEDETKLLYETIRKELNSIISDNESKSRKIKNVPEEVDVDSSRTATSSPNPPTSKTSVVSFSKDCKKELENIPETKAAIEVQFLDNQAGQDIDTDLRIMQSNLRQSYELFQTIGDKFETINFAGLRNRIKDLHLNSNKNNSDERLATNNELHGIFEETYTKNKLDKLTTKMGEKFNQHPGEFGNIPEISDFFKACSQLQHGLAELKRQRDDVNTIEKRIDWAAGVSLDRIDEIKRTISEDYEKP